MQEGRFWVACGIDYYVVAQGRNLKEAMELFASTFIDTMRLHFEEGYAEKELGITKPLAPLPPAPKKIQAMWNKAFRTELEENVKTELEERLREWKRPSRFLSSFFGSFVSKDRLESRILA